MLFSNESVAPNLRRIQGPWPASHRPCLVAGDVSPLDTCPGFAWDNVAWGIPDLRQ